MPQNTHAHKAESYNIGRPSYPKAFYEYVHRLGLTKGSKIADIGAGTGKVMKGFLEHGSTVYAVEPDKDMLKILCRNLAGFTGCIPIESTAEDTGIPDNAVDLIFCGNSYHWFDRSRAIPEFKRILRNSGKQFDIVIASLGPGRGNEAPFVEGGLFAEKSFEYTVYDGFHEYLHGHLSASCAPVPGDDDYKNYCDSLKKSFDEQSKNGKIATKFILHCMVGRVENLIP